jgi:hypothetical protein
MASIKYRNPIKIVFAVIENSSEGPLFLELVHSCSAKRGSSLNGSSTLKELVPQFEVSDIL